VNLWSVTIHLTKIRKAEKTPKLAFCVWFTFGKIISAQKLWSAEILFNFPPLLSALSFWLNAKFIQNCNAFMSLLKICYFAQHMLLCM
jgi:hypothetical protein